MTRAKKLFKERGDEYREDDKAIHLGYGAELARQSERQNDFQSYGYLTNYFEYKISEDELKPTNISEITLTALLVALI